MKNFSATAIRYLDGQVQILDQELLPWKTDWISVRDAQHLREIILALKVRGAPLIGVAAALQLAATAKKSSGNLNLETFTFDANLLRSARPTAVNLMHTVDRMLRCANETGCDGAALESEALRIAEEDVQLCERISANALPHWRGFRRVMTICNTGSLATAGFGTAFGILLRAKQAGLLGQVWVTETRPLLQGARLTVWECEQHQLPYQLITDNMAASLMASGNVDLVIAGADRIAQNGDTANKIGTYSLAVLAKAHGIPFWIAAPQTTFDLNCQNASDIEIEQRKASEVTGVRLPQQDIAWSIAGTKVWNPAFDVTPAGYIHAWINDLGFFTNPQEFWKGIK